MDRVTFKDAMGEAYDYPETFNIEHNKLLAIDHLVTDMTKPLNLNNSREAYKASYRMQEGKLVAFTIIADDTAVFHFSVRGETVFEIIREICAWFLDETSKWDFDVMREFESKLSVVR